MHRRFNTAGPNDPADHHTLPVLARLGDVRRLIDEKLYFVLHAPRQAGKTTALRALARELTDEGRYTAVVLSMESGAPFRDQLGMAEDAILDAWQGAASRRLPSELRPPAWPNAPPGRRIARALQAWAEETPRPLVILLDEIDALEDQTLLSVLRQLRDGFTDRPYHFPWSLILSGMRDVPDYKIASGPGGQGGADDPFNVRSDPLTLRDFSHDELATFYAQHTEDTGQVFLPVAIDRAFRLTRGQPWLVNALARQIVETLVPDRSVAITATHVESGRKLLERRRETHFDSLAEQLYEPRLRVLLEPMLRGDPLGVVSEEDRRLALDLGLVRSSEAGALAIANPIYRDVLLRLLASGRKAAPPQLTATWVAAEGVLDEEASTAAPAVTLPPQPTVRTISRPPVTPSIAPSVALARTSRTSIESFPPEELTEWFRPIAPLPSVVGKTPSKPPKGDAAVHSPPKATRTSAKTIGTALDRRWRSRPVRVVAIGATGCAAVALMAGLLHSSESPAEATPAASSIVATMPPATAQSTQAPQSPPTSSTTAASASAMSAGPAPEARSAPKPSSEPSASRGSAPERIPRVMRTLKPVTAIAPESHPETRIVPALPALPPPDEEKMRRQLEPKVWSGEASTEEIRMLKAICSSDGDRGCRDRASEMLKRREQ